MHLVAVAELERCGWMLVVDGQESDNMRKYRREGKGMGFNRRQAWIVVVAVVALSALAGCGGSQGESDAAAVS